MSLPDHLGDTLHTVAGFLAWTAILGIVVAAFAALVWAALTAPWWAIFAPFGGVSLAIAAYIVWGMRQ